MGVGVGWREVKGLRARVTGDPVSEGQQDPQPQDTSVSAHVIGWELSVALSVTTSPPAMNLGPHQGSVSL